MGKEDSKLPTIEQTEKFEMLYPMLKSSLIEMREFSKKKQDGVLNLIKVSIINRLLQQVKDLLSGDPVSEYLDLLDNETLPQNSDAVLILGHFVAAMDQFKEKYYGFYNYEYKWLTCD